MYKRQVFVGNLPNTITKKKIIKYFRKFGTVANTRLRYAAVSDPRLPKRRTVVKKEFHKDRTNKMCIRDRSEKLHSLHIRIVKDTSLRASTQILEKLS